MSHVLQEETFEVDGQKYLSKRMSAFDQHAVASRLGGVLLLMFENSKKRKNPIEEKEFSRAFLVLSGDIRKIDMDLVFDLCFAGVQRQQGEGGGWAKVLTDMSGVMAFPDIDMPEMLAIVWHVLKQHRIPDFFIAPPSTSQGQKKGEE